MDGHVTRRGVLVRADDLGQLSADGWHAALEHGVTRVLDLRFAEERTRERYVAPVPVVAVSLFGPLAEDFHGTWERGAAEASDAVAFHAETYINTFTERREAIRDALEAVCEATDGTLIVHCVAGKDRTGIVSACALAIAGVGVDTIAADYAASEPAVAATAVPWIAAAETEQQRAGRRRLATCPAEAMHRAVSFVTAEWGSVRAYLIEVGVASSALDALRVRLSGARP